MCKRRKQVKQKVIQKRNTRVKRKRTCCQKCRRKIRNWLCKRIKRCIKNTVFGDPNPQLDGFEIAGINLGSVRDHLKINKSQKFLNKDKEINVENKSTLITLFKKNRDKSSKSIPFKNAIINEYDRYSISKSIGKKVKSFINDFKERNIFLGISKDSKLYLEKDEKEKFRNLAEKYEKKSVLFRSYENLKKRFHLTASKSVIFRKMLDDYKKILLTAISLKINADSCTCPKNSIDIQTESSGQKLSNLESTEQVTERRRKRCCPYNFDGKLCRAVGDRVLCGYNRNVGGPESGDGDLELQNGCQIRQGRLECGYNQPPFLNSRRPPVWDYVMPEEFDDKKPNDLEFSSKEEKIQKLHYQSTNIPRLTTRCVEIKERIVCRKI